MKILLILAYDFPPLNSIGAQRPYSWYKYFKNYGLYPIVVTRNWDQNPNNLIHKKEVNGEIFYSPYKESLRDRILNRYGSKKYNFFRKLISLTIQLTQYFTNIFDSKNTIFKTAESIVKKEKIDYIIATGEPFILFKYAHIISKKYKIPWFADYRDGWTNNYNIKYSNFLTRIINKYFFEYFEKVYLKSAKQVFTVSDDLSTRISHLSKREVIIIRNGFNIEHFNSNKKQSKLTFNIIYAGSIYPYQRLDIFLKGFKDFILDHNKNIKLSFYGTFDEIPTFIADLGLSKYIESHQRIPQNEIVDKMKEASILLLLAGDENDGSAAKIYDYLAAGRKILLSINDNGTLEKIINETNSGYICNNEEDIYNSLKISYREWSLNGYVKCKTQNISNYDRNFQAKLLSEHILAINK